MPKKRSWTDDELRAAVAASKSYRAVLIKLRLIPAGGNYKQIQHGDHHDNRLDNLRILCPNCHSLQPTHRGKNKKVHRARVS